VVWGKTLQDPSEKVRFEEYFPLKMQEKSLLLNDNIYCIRLPGKRIHSEFYLQLQPREKNAKVVSTRTSNVKTHRHIVRIFKRRQGLNKPKLCKAVDWISQSPLTQVSKCSLRLGTSGSALLSSGSWLCRVCAEAGRPAPICRSYSFAP
jgi:hypothetical protein